ncbi:MAG TPA: ABC transporter ATP-binding protein [Myxococcales bacterium]|nr:dipeptide/oligopeptide/nickel ABC transporter ATP-binding protein [Deltaproteobacteria bacterium]HAA53258.1 ABC transporter ATP-binding protein [Myxococcales bacterium]|tara:strand:+ start:26533 stop:27498 length:966 start_codon:yes stop_codon:yes gene_type:complete
MVEEKKPILSIEDLRIYFRSRGRWVYAVDGVSLDIKEGEGVAVIGESGSGKTLTILSMLALISGQPGVVDGKIHYHDDEIDVNLLQGVRDVFEVQEGRKLKVKGDPELWQSHFRKRAQELAGCRIGIIFQNPIASQDPLWSVGQTLRESIRLRDPSMPRAKVQEEAVEWLRRVHIKNPEGVMRSYPHQLSGGMCQRVMIASTLAMRPKIIIADEPTTGLDMTTKAQVLYLLREAREKYGSALVFITHEIGLVTGLTDKIVVMNKGKVVDQFPASALQNVEIKDGTLSAEHTFAQHTQDLLECSLALEQPRERKPLVKKSTE